MKLDPSESQSIIINSVEKLMERHGSAYLSNLDARNCDFDAELYNEFEMQGFLQTSVDEEYGALEAALVIYEVTKHGGRIPAGASLLVYPQLVGEPALGPVALASGDASSPVRFLQNATVLLTLTDDKVFRLDLEPDDVEIVDNGNVGWPLGRLRPHAHDRMKELPGASPSEMRSWWQTAISLETSGLMRGALDVTAQYVKDRKQFEQQIGAFQSVQHRLAHLAVQTEGVRWLALRAASHAADAIEASTAATYAMKAGPAAVSECHQLHGAIGFTREYRLHIWTMRLAALQSELGGKLSHGRTLTQQKFIWNQN